MICYEFTESEQINRIPYICGLKFDDLSDREKMFYKYLRGAGYKYVIPECVRRVILLSDSDGIQNDCARETIWRQAVTVSTLKNRAKQNYETYPDRAGQPGYDRWGRVNITYTDNGVAKVSHVDPLVIVYCSAPSHIKTEHKKRKVAF